MHKIRLRNIITISYLINSFIKIIWFFTRKWIFSLIVVKSKSFFHFFRNLWSNLTISLIILYNNWIIWFFLKSHSLIFKFALSHLFNINLKFSPNSLCSLHLILISLSIFKWKIRLYIMFPISQTTLQVGGFYSKIKLIFLWLLVIIYCLHIQRIFRNLSCFI